MKLILRLITIICYFSPFIFFFATCNGISLRFSYNQAEADKNMLLQEESSIAVADTVQYAQQTSADTSKTNLTTQNALQDTVEAPSSTLPKSTNYTEKILKKIITPTSTSLSGIGSILYFKNIIGQIVLTIGLLISLILLIAFRFLKSQKAKIYLLFMAILCQTIFIVDCFVSSVTLLWGSWTLLALLLVQIILQSKEIKKIG